MLDSAGKRVAANGLNWVLNRLDSNWQWYRRDGQWNYEAVTLTRKIADGMLDATADGALPKIEAGVDWGRYKLEITSADPSGPSASTAFNAGWYTAANEAESPEDASTSRSTAPATSRAKPPSCALPPRTAARRSSRCCPTDCSRSRRSTCPMAAAKPT